MGEPSNNVPGKILFVLFAILTSFESYGGVQLLMVQERLWLQYRFRCICDIECDQTASTPCAMAMGLFLLSLSIIALLHFGRSQVDRFRNPWVNVVRRHSCVIVECNFGETCDLSYQNCRESGPCYLKEPSCVSAFNLPRNGACPDPRVSMIAQFSVDCFDDAGCDAPQICCHSFTGSYCWFPRTRQTVRSMIPRNTNRSVQRISENGTFVFTPRDDNNGDTSFLTEPRLVGDLPLFRDPTSENNEQTVFIFRDPELGDNRAISVIGNRPISNDILNRQTETPNIFPDNRLISTFRDRQTDLNSGFSVFSDRQPVSFENRITGIPNSVGGIQNNRIPTTVQVPQTNRQIIGVSNGNVPNDAVTVLRNRGLPSARRTIIFTDPVQTSSPNVPVFLGQQRRIRNSLRNPSQTQTIIFRRN